MLLRPSHGSDNDDDDDGSGGDVAGAAALKNLLSKFTFASNGAARVASTF